MPLSPRATGLAAAKRAGKRTRTSSLLAQIQKICCCERVFSYQIYIQLYYSHKDTWFEGRTGRYLQKEVRRESNYSNMPDCLTSTPQWSYHQALKSCGRVPCSWGVCLKGLYPSRTPVSLRTREARPLYNMGLISTDPHGPARPLARPL
jgi:hypothetical protein